MVGPLALFVLIAAGPASPDVRLRFDGTSFYAEGEGVAAALETSRPEALLVVFVLGAPSGSPALAGEYTAGPSALAFRPKYPLSEGVSYRAVWRPGEISTVVRVPPVARPPTQVERVYPSGSRLPENQLKLYLLFTAPMSRGEAYRRVRLLDDQGSAGDLPFLEIDQELWDPEGRRLTLLFDPGRIKRGVLPREELGSALVPGRSYTLVVDEGWPDAAGRPLAGSYRKPFTVMQADREPIDPARWRLLAPPAGSREPLVADFGEPLDAALAVRLLEVFDSQGRRVAGEASLEREETRWVFRPKGAWSAGRHELRVSAALEDLAGNRVGRAFDVDVFERVERRAAAPTVTIAFEVSAPSR